MDKSVKALTPELSIRMSQDARQASTVSIKGCPVAPWFAQLVSEARGPGSSPCWGHCVVFLGKTITFKVPLSTEVYE